MVTFTHRTGSAAEGPPQGPAALCDDGRYARMCADVLKALAHPLRLRIVAALCDGKAHVTALAERLGAGQPAVSQQLRILRMRGLVAVERQGAFARYRLAEPELEPLVSCIVHCSAVSDRLARCGAGSQGS